jgi:hypothetical protein
MTKIGEEQKYNNVDKEWQNDNKKNRGVEKACWKHQGC